ncbi:MAG: Gfo/Idh/MocA family oxidoreductase, partial [Cyclobacteriaceae bacterium]|nr:Gfo/Idh/MocA family oxidoreductase [Cyclobacteriaceae bacterium]
MDDISKNSRRGFIKKVAGTALAGAAVPGLALGRDKQLLVPGKNPFSDKKFTANDKIRLGVVGAGIISHFNIDSALAVNGVELVAACDLYDGRLKQVKEKYGQHIFTTRDYKELISRNDVDAVLVATSDHWHDHITIAALDAGKAVYCEKPMVHKIEEGAAMIRAEKKNGGVLQIGSNPTSGITLQKVKELYESGAIGQLVLVDAVNDRHSALGAWQYSIPRDASTTNIDWDRFIGDAPKVAFDPVRFFRWRNYQDYGTGIAGDLYVHLYSALHFVTGSTGPERIYASGGLRYWKDGRDVPDVMVSIADYPATDRHPAFQFTTRVNFVAGGDRDGGVTFVGSEGSIKVLGNRIILSKDPIPEAPGYGGYDSLFTFPQETQDEYVKYYNEKYYSARKRLDVPPVEYSAPQGYDNRVDHWINFARGIREGHKIVQNGEFGLRAAAPSLAANLSYFNRKMIDWDPVKMALK